MTTTASDPADVDSSTAMPNRGRSRLAPFLPTTRAQRVVGVLALVFLGSCVGYFIGFRDGGLDSPSAQSADVGFLYDMSAHHQQAVQLSMIELSSGSNPSVQTFAREIIRSQSYEVGLMQMLLGTWGFDPADRPQSPMAWMGMSLSSSGAMPGMADAQELEAFRAAEGSDVDAMFLALMSDHHAGGVAMAKAAAAAAGDDWVVETAARMARFQASEIVELEFAREAAGLDAQPEGFVSDFGSEDADMGDMHVESPGGG